MEDRLITHVLPSIHHLPKGLWDEKIAKGHPFKSSAFMACLEASSTKRRFGYILINRGDVHVGVAVVTEEVLDLTLVIPPMVGRILAPIRKVFPNFLRLHLGMVGTFQTALRHWWFDREQIRESEFVEQLLIGVRAVCKHSSLLLVRDFEEGRAEDASLEKQFVASGFVRLLNHPIAIARLDGLSIDAHFHRLKGKSRANVRNKLRQAEQLGFRFERVTNFTELIDACYPLYLQVHERAADFRREPIPKRFFKTLAARMPEQCCMLLMRAADDRLLAFILTGISERVSNPAIMGMDYPRTYGTPAYYAMLWKELEYAAERGCHEVDLGLTSYFVKQTLGAEVIGMSMAVRLERTWLRPVLQPLLPFLLGAKQPVQRRRFRVNRTGRQQPHPHGRNLQ